MKALARMDIPIPEVAAELICRLELHCAHCLRFITSGMIQQES